MKQILLSIVVIGILLLSACGAPAETPPTSPPTEQQTYTLSVSVSPSGAGSVSPSSGQYESGAQVTLTSTPASGYTFDYWDGDASGSSATIIITMDSDKSVIARFKVTEPEPIEFSGHGDGVSPEFILEEGITIITMTHDGRSNFAIWLYDVGTGERVDLLVNEIGPFSGSAVIGVTGEIFGASPGRHLLDITADGNWKVTIEQPRPTTAPTAPQAFTGTGCSVSPPFMLETGIARFEMTHDGRSNFAIWVYDKDGYRIDLLVNEIGAYSGSKVVGVTGKIFDASPGIHYLAITADGSWTVSISQ